MNPSLPSPTSAPRRTGQLRLGGRSERVIRDVTRATAAELARVGYDALRVEDVAAQAGVNKTTVYRRWPNKADLVADAFRNLKGPPDELPDLGSVRADLLSLLQDAVVLASTCEGQSVYRMITLEMDHPEVASIARALRDEYTAPWIAVIERAIDRRELPEGSDPQLLVEMIKGTVFNKLLRNREPVDDAFLHAVVNMVVLGAKSGGAIRSGGGAPSAPMPVLNHDPAPLMSPPPKPTLPSPPLDPGIRIQARDKLLRAGPWPRPMLGKDVLKALAGDELPAGAVEALKELLASATSDASHLGRALRWVADQPPLYEMKLASTKDRDHFTWWQVVRSS
jgi:AcrR family transcriptional regulator